MKSRSLLKMLAIIGVSSLMTSCASAQFEVRFDSVGEYVANQQRIISSIKNPDEVRVFYGSAPEGFSLKENELKVEKGYDHQILGFITVNREPTSGAPSEDNNKSFILNELKKSAYEQGANAVIYAYSHMSEKPTPREMSRHFLVVPNDNIYGKGWAVIMK